MNENLIEVWFNFSKYYSRIYKAIDYTLKDNYEIEIKEFILLYTLLEAKKKKKEFRLQDLHSIIDLSLSALSRMVTRLQNHKDGELVLRVTYPEDKRSAYIVLSETGQVLLKSILVTLDDALQKSLSPKDIKNIVELLK
nr:hypothetical protein [Terribacillus saccharophilus]